MNIQFLRCNPHMKVYVHGYAFTFILNIFIQKSDGDP